ncbi:MAG: response regulator [Pseudomonadota bacterium]
MLHLEDDPADAELAQARLDEAGLSYRITRVQTREEFDEALDRAGYDIILADYRLPLYDGMSALRLARKRCPDIPFIFVSGAMGEEAAIEALTQGATDYVLKQNLLRLASAIKRGLQEAENRRKHRLAEEKIRMLNETLEQRVAERTAELENRTQQLQKLALELSDAEDRERRRIASILHDDFQQELAYIKMELRILQKNKGKKVRQQLGSLEQLIGGSIEKSRDLSYEINPPALHRSGLLAALAVLARDMKAKSGLSVTVRTQPDAESVSLALASILYRCARELLLNVLKHAGVNSAIMEVHSKNGMIHIRVEDFGNGFDYETVRSNQGRGAGFGLYNIEDRITFLGGSMKIRTAPGKGCCVVLTAPEALTRRAVIPAPPCNDPVHPELIGIEPAEPRQSVDDSSQIRILLADDHQLMREALANLLKGCKGMAIVGQANDGREAIELAAQLKPQVILMDVTMPVLDGFEATAQITRDHPDIRIIALSMHNDAHTRQKMLDAGAGAYLIKTGSPDTLVETIRRVFRSNK